jgi:hypothetical protein
MRTPSSEIGYLRRVARLLKVARFTHCPRFEEESIQSAGWLRGRLWLLSPISGPCERAGVLLIEGAQCRLDAVTEASDALFDGRTE